MNEETLNNLSREEAIKLLDSEIDYSYQLKHNWNELKKYLEENKYFYSGYQGEDLEEDISIIGVLNKMQELEEVSNE